MAMDDHVDRIACGLQGLVVGERRVPAGTDRTFALRHMAARADCAIDILALGLREPAGVGEHHLRIGLRDSSNRRKEQSQSSGDSERHHGEILS
ncbi:hypothetical protein D3C87_1852190 [compost metagenome]